MKKIVFIFLALMLLAGCAGVPVRQALKENTGVPAGKIEGSQFIGVRYPFKVSAPSHWKVTMEFPDFLEEMGYDRPSAMDKEQTELYIFNPETKSSVQFDFTPAGRYSVFSQEGIERLTTIATGRFKEELMVEGCRYVALVATDPAHQRRGFADAAMRRALELSAEAHGERPWSWVKIALAVLAALLSGLAGRLFDELRERRALAYTVHAAPWLRRRGGAVLTYIATSPEREDEARAAMLDLLHRVADAPLGDDELERAALYAAGQVAIRRQHGAAIAEELADAWLLGRVEAFETEEARRRSVSAEDVRRVARAALDPDRRAEFVVRGVGGGR